MPQEFPNIPQQAPNGNQNPNNPNINNNPGAFEAQKNWQRSLARSSTIKASAKKIIGTREDLASYLKTFGIDLLTSASEFQESRDFIRSSYVYYRDLDYKEHIIEFLKRYPQLQTVALQIRDQLKNQSLDLEVKTKTK